MKMTLNQMLVELDGFKPSEGAEGGSAWRCFAGSLAGNVMKLHSTQAGMALCVSCCVGVTPLPAGVIVIAATNFPESLDKALVRPGRFDRHVVVRGAGKRGSGWPLCLARAV